MKTNTLNLENYGVQKMSEREMKEIEGGEPITAIISAAFGIYALGVAFSWWSGPRLTPGVGTPRPSSSGVGGWNTARIQ